MSNLTSFSFNNENPFATPDIKNLGSSIFQELNPSNDSDELFMTSEINSREQITGNSTFIKKVYVDKEYFQNVVLNELTQFFKLKPITRKVLEFILNNKGSGLSGFTLNVQTIMKEVGCSQASAFRALGELCYFRIIARGNSETHYYINPICKKCTKSVSFSTCYVSK